MRVLLDRTNTRKNIVKVSIALIILVICIFFVIPVISWASTDSDRLVTEVFELMSIERAKEALSLDGPVYEASQILADNLSKILTGVAALYITALVLYSILQETSKGNATMEMWTKIFIKFVIGMFLIIFTLPILKGIDDFGKWAIDALTKAQKTAIMSGGQSLDHDELMNRVSEAVNASATNQGITYTGVVMVSGVLTIYVKIMSYALIIELSLRRIFAPVAVATIVTEGARSTGMKYLKKYLALYLKMALLVLVVGLAGWICEILAATQTNILSLLECLAVMCACMTFIGKGANLVDEVVGAVQTG